MKNERAGIVCKLVELMENAGSDIVNKITNFMKIGYRKMENHKNRYFISI